jgi:hypothetical protein
MRRVLALFAALSLGAAGCSTSSVDPDATVRISGRALDPSGKPLSGARVLLLKDADIGEVVLGTVLAIGTLSTVCLLPEPPAICRKARTTTTDDDGRYEFELKGSDTQGTLGTEATLNVVFSGPRGHGSTTVSFVAKDTSITLPDARLWKAAPEVSQPSGRIDLSWTPLPKAAGSDAEYSAQLFEGDTEAATWSQPATGGQASIDPRILEDRSGSVAVGATATLPGGSGTGDVRSSYLSTRLPVDAVAGAPPSRGRRCAPVTGTAPRLGDPPATCPVTDGDLAAAAGFRVDGKAVVTGVVVDLSSVRPVDLVVARGFAGQFLVEVSSDGTAFQLVGTQLGTTVAVAPAGQPSARYVRVRSPSGLDESLASEVSVW